MSTLVAPLQSPNRATAAPAACSDSPPQGPQAGFSGASQVVFLPHDRLPGDVIAFWRDACRINDPTNSFLCGPDWYAMMAKGRGPGSQVAVLKRGDGAIRAVAPILPDTRQVLLTLAGRRLTQASLPVVAVCGGDVVDVDASLDELDKLLTEILTHYPQAQGVWCDHVKTGSRTDRLITLARSRRRYCFQTLYTVPQFRLIMPKTAEAFRNLRSRKTVARMESKERALHRSCKGDCRVIEVKSPADWLPYADKIESLMNNTWQAQELGLRFDVGELTELAARKWLRSFLLVAGNEAAAFALCYQSGDVFAYARIGYDNRFAKYSPGTILLYRLLDHLYTDNTPTYVDLGDGEFGYKKELANDILHANASLILRKTSAHCILLRLYGMTRALNKAGRVLLEHARRVIRPVTKARSGDKVPS